MLKIKLSGIKHMELFAHSNPELISLSQGSLKIGGIPKEIKSYVQDLLNTDKTDYYANPYGIKPLREKIAEMLSKKHTITISEEQVVITHGSSGAISNIFFMVLKPGDEVLLPEPTYPAYANLTQIAKAKPVFVSCYSDHNLSTIDWNVAIEKIKSATTSRTKIITIANPCNPTGEIIPPNILEKLIDWCNQNEIYLVSDEVYDDYIFDAKNFKSAASYVNKSSYVIRCGSFSKNFSMSGWRVGYLVIPKTIAPLAVAIQDSLIVCPSVVGQYAALCALSHTNLTKFFNEEVHNNLILANAMLQPLVKKGIISYQKPKAAFYLFLKTNLKDTTDLCFDLLQKAKITTVPGKAFGPSGSSFIRICYARPRQMVEEGLRRFLNYWAK